MFPMMTRQSLFALLATVVAIGSAVPRPLHGDILVDPRRMKVGESACVFPVHFSAEGHIWLSPAAVYRNRDGCIMTMGKTGDGWVVNLRGIPIPHYGSESDRELQRFLAQGWFQVAPGSVIVKNDRTAN